MKKALLFLIISGAMLISGCTVATPRVHWDWSSPWFPGSFVLSSLVGLALYFLPTIIIIARRKRKVLGPILVNVLLGWTVIGWIVALIWALTADE